LFFLFFLFLLLLLCSYSYFLNSKSPKANPRKKYTRVKPKVHYITGAKNTIKISCDGLWVVRFRIWIWEVCDSCWWVRDLTVVCGLVMTSLWLGGIGVACCWSPRIWVMGLGCFCGLWKPWLLCCIEAVWTSSCACLCAFVGSWLMNYVCSLCYGRVTVCERREKNLDWYIAGFTGWSIWPPLCLCSAGFIVFDFS